MAFNLDAILRVAARVEGQEQVRGMSRDLQNVGKSADGSVRGVTSLGAAMGGLRNVAAALGFAGVVAGLTAFGVRAVRAGEDSTLLARRVEALAGPLGEVGRVQELSARMAKTFTMGQQDAARAVTDLYGRLRPLGIELPQIETAFVGVNKTIRLAGLSGVDAKESFNQLAQAIGSGRLQGDEFRSLMERIPALGTAIANVFNRIRSEGGLTLVTKEQADAQIKAVRDGEKGQTEELREGIRRRKEMAEESGNEELRRIARHYDKVRQIMDDKNTDADNAEEKARNKRMDGQQREIEGRYQSQRKALDREYEDRQRAISNTEGLSEEYRTARMRELQDEHEERRTALQDQQDAEMGLLKDAEDRRVTERQRQLRDRRQLEMQAINDEQRAKEDVVRQDMARQQRELEAGLEQQIQANKDANEKIIAGILSRIRVTQGDLKKMASDGLINSKIMIMALEDMAKAKMPDPTPLMKFNTAFADLTTKIGTELLPKLTPLIEKATAMLSDPKFLTALEDLIKGIGEVILPLIPPILSTLATILKAFASLPADMREAIVRLGVLWGIFRLFGGPQILKGIGDVIGKFKELTGVAAGANAAAQAPKFIQMDLFGAKKVPQVSAQAAKEIPKIGAEAAKIIPRLTELWKGFSSQIGPTARAFGGLLQEVKTFGGAFVREIGVAIPALGRLGTAFANLRIGATIAGWLPVVTRFPQLAIAALTPLITWITGTLVPTLVGVFSGPAGWIALGVIALTAGLILWREPITKFIEWIFEAIGKFTKAFFKFIYDNTMKPWVTLWQTDLLKPIRDETAKWLEPIKKLFVNIITVANDWYKTNDWTKFWDKLWYFPVNMIEQLKTRFAGLLNIFIDVLKRMSNPASEIFEAIKDKITSAWGSIVSGTRYYINKMLMFYNKMAEFINKNPTPIKLPIVPYLYEGQAEPRVNAALGFATGGFIQRPTLGWLAEAGQSEYAIPAGSMGQAMAGYAAGLRGQELVNHWQSPGPLPPATGGAPGMAGPVALTVQVAQRGPIMQMPDGSQWVSREEAIAMVQASSQATIDGLTRMMRGRM